MKAIKNFEMISVKKQFVRIAKLGPKQIEMKEIRSSPSLRTEIRISKSTVFGNHLFIVDLKRNWFGVHRFIGLMSIMNNHIFR